MRAQSLPGVEGLAITTAAEFMAEIQRSAAGNDVEPSASCTGGWKAWAAAVRAIGQGHIPPGTPCESARSDTLSETPCVPWTLHFPGSEMVGLGGSAAKCMQPPAHSRMHLSHRSCTMPSVNCKSSYPNTVLGTRAVCALGQNMQSTQMYR